MDNDYLAGYWKAMHIVVDELQNEYFLENFFKIKSCLGQHGGGVLFIVKNDLNEEESLILKCEDDYCYRKVGDTGDDDRDWIYVGTLFESSDPPDMPPYI